VTLCLAAECTHEGKSQYVFAKDFKVETGTSAGEIEAKYTWIGKVEYPALFANSPSRAMELADLIGQRLDSDESNQETFVEVARHGVRELKRRVANEYVGALLGITWDKVIGGTQTILTPEKRREIEDDVSRLQIKCSLLWMAFDEKHTHLIHVDEDGSVDRRSHFCAIGSGGYVAESALFYREHKNEASLGTAIYNVYEAMKLGAKAPGVGEKFSLHIASSDEGKDKITWQEITDEYYELLEKQFAKFGPKKTGDVPLRAKWIEESNFN
jgi:Proteasome subunit